MTSASGAGVRLPLNRRARRTLGSLPPPALFVIAGVSQHAGAATAVLLFAAVPPTGVAWLRVLSAAAVLAIWRRPWRGRWTPVEFGVVAVFGTALAAMNLAFYLAIDQLPLGTAVAIEFLGPISVAAAGTRTRRDLAALLLAIAGVLLLAEVRWAGSAGGVALALLAAALWAVYIVAGSRLAATGKGVDGLAAGMVVGAAALAPLGVPAASAAATDVGLLAACLGVGLLSSVVPYALDQVVLARVNAAGFALLLSLMPAIATSVGLVVLRQVPTAPEAVGITLVAVAVASRSRT